MAMNVKIQGGGGGTYANTGSSAGVVSYLQHEDLERIQQGKEQEHFFNQTRDKVSAKEVTYKIDHNKAKLCNKDAKFYMITVSPSAKELGAMGKTPEEQAKAMQDYIRNEVMPQYAEGFGKGLSAKDIEYYAKIHHTRKDKEGAQLHAHIIVSRKDVSNSIKLSPMTNHRKGGKSAGTVKSGFDRTAFYEGCERGFDRRMSYDRDVKETFEYNNAVQHGTPKEIREQSERVVAQDKERASQRKQETQREQQQQQKGEYKREYKQENSGGLKR